MGAGASSQGQGIPGITLEAAPSAHAEHGASGAVAAAQLSVPRNKTNLSRHHSSRRRRDKDILRRDSSKRRANKPIGIQVKNGSPGVDLSNSKLNFISADLFERPDVTNIKWLDASYNEIQEIPSDVRKLVCLKSLNFDNNFIKDINESVKDLSILTNLILSNNHITTFSPAIIQIKNLTELSLSNNKLQSLPDDIGELSNIQCLYVSHNMLTKLPKSFGNLKHLRVLDVRYNNLESLPESIEHMTNLERLQAYCNNLSYLPEGLGSCLKLKVLRVSSNKLTSFPLSLSNLKALETLDVHNNKLSHLPDCIFGLSNLSELHIGDNEITHFNDSLKGLINLRTLKANSNGLQCLPPFLDSLVRLKHLHIRNNVVRTLPESMSNMESLEVFDAKNNPIHFPPREVWERGLSAIKAYFEEIRRSGSLRSSRLKITVLGAESSGKTSFINSLTQNCVKKDIKSTIGINVSRWIPVEDPNMAFILWDHSGNPLYDSTHQFFFSPGSLVFLVIDMSRYEPEKDNSYTARIGKWVNMLRKFGGDNVIQIIGTHNDLCSEEETKLKTEHILKKIQTDVNKITKDFDHRYKTAEEMLKLFQTYQKAHNHSDISPYICPSPLSPSASEEPVKDVVDSIKKIKGNQPKFLSNIPLVANVGDMDGVKDFRRILFKLTQDKKRYPTVELFLPKSWLDLEDEVKALKAKNPVPVIPLSQLINIAQSNDPDFKEKDIMEALLYLHMTGEVLHFVGTPGLKHYVFVSPIWLIDVIKCVINPYWENSFVSILKNHVSFLRTDSEDAFKDHGQVSQNILRKLWENFDLDSDQFKLLQTLATSFGLWYPEMEGTEKYYIIPTLMTPTHYDMVIEQVDIIQDIQPNHYSQVEFCSLPPTEYQIVMKFVFPYGLPIGLFSRAAVKCRRHVAQYTFHSNHCFAGTHMGVSTVCVATENDAGEECITLCTRATKETLLPMWRLILNILNEIEELLQQWQGLLFYRFLVCPHCFLANELTPFHFLGEWHKASLNRLPEIVKIACPVARGAVRVHLKLLYPPKNAHILPTQVSDSEIQLVAASVGDNWPTLAALLGITEDDYKLFDIVSSDPYGHVLAMLQFWVAEKKEYATSEELNNAVKILNSKTQGEDEDKTEKTETIKYL